MEENDKKNKVGILEKIKGLIKINPDILKKFKVNPAKIKKNYLY